jgi:hypothetical protein
MELWNLQMNKKVKVAGNEITVEEFIDEAYNLCRADEKIRELKHGLHSVRTDHEVYGRDDQEKLC